ncbi:hypothetical protein EG329_006066 [Mollisiaceae sp. DMI_Dod_QoI]|nr:hypothetical protein EG329_006066 [Helotiales sp. DMI_Dod_QoI]
MSPLGKDTPSDRKRRVQNYYASLESKIGYHLLLGGTRHYGYYPTSTSLPIPVGRPLRAMEDHVYERLQLAPGAYVLDAGCGDGFVAIRMAQRGIRVQGIEIVDRHVRHAKRNIRSQHPSLEAAITIRKGDYHDLSVFDDGTFDGAYTMETLVHSADPQKALKEIYRVLKPGGSLALNEYHHCNLSSAPKPIRRSFAQINYYSSMPSFTRFELGVLKGMIEETGFEKVTFADISDNVTPMVRLFFLLAYIPFFFVELFGVQEHFINTVAGVTGYRGREYLKYGVYSAKKPSYEDEKSLM